ncbi:MAG: DUF3801 domain-containing protein, partial [Oscillibacter sp.]|nr:DUF3801 domain-containing protein [Oscillibacter sp.]
MDMERKTLAHVVRIALSDTEVEVRVSGLTLRNLLVLAWSFAGKHKKMQGALNLAKALKTTRDIRVFAMTPAQFHQFCEKARQSKVLFASVWDKGGKAKGIDVLLPETELERASLILKQMAYNLTDTKPEPVQSPTQPELDTVPEPQPELDTVPEPQPEAVVEPQAEPESVPEPQSEPEAVVEPEPEAVAEPEPESVSAQSEPEPDTVPEPEPESVSAQSEPVVEPQAEPEAVAEPQSEPEPVPEPEPTQPEPEAARTESIFKKIRASKRPSTAWNEIGSVEPDMRERKARDRRDGVNAFYIADYALGKYPLAGQYIPTPEEEALLYQRAQRAVEKILNDQPINNGDAAVLVVETANRLKSWDNVSEKKDSFWRYIFRQYGFQAERFGKAQESLLYEKFRLSIDRALDREHYNRFAVSDGHRYYATLLLHALAPKRSIENFFDILFSFYAENLDFQYVSGD